MQFVKEKAVESLHGFVSETLAPSCCVIREMDHVQYVQQNKCSRM